MGASPATVLPLARRANGSRTGIDRDFLEALGGESQAVVTAETTLDWAGQKLGALELRADSAGVVDFASAFSGPTDRQLAYAFAQIESPKAQLVRARFGSDDSALVFLNGERVHRVIMDRGIDPDSDAFDLSLAEGTAGSSMRCCPRPPATNTCSAIAFPSCVRSAGRRGWCSAMPSPACAGLGPISRK